MAFLHRLLQPCHSLRLATKLSSRRLLSTTSSSNRDLDNIMNMLGLGTQAPALGDSANYLTIRQAVSECLERFKDPTKQPGADLQPLTQAQQDELDKKVLQWTTKYQQEWQMNAELEASKEKRRQALAAKAIGSEADTDLRSASQLQDAEKKRNERDAILAVLPSIAEEYVRNKINWESEFVRLDEEVQRALMKKKAQDFTKLYLESDPMKKYADSIQKEEHPEPVMIQLSTLLEHIDPRFATKLRESGMTIEDRHIDMSRPHEVVKTLTDLGYSVDKDGDLNDVNHLTFPYDAQQREQLMRGLRPNGTPMTENEKWQKIFETPEITSPALEHKRKQIDHYVKQQRHNKQIPPLPTDLNLELLPEELRPTIDDLDPDAKPVYANKDTIQHSACPICQKPKTGPGSRQSCGLRKHDQANVTHTNVELLTEFVNELGMILPKKKTGVCSKQQRQVARAIKRSRQMGLMPYTTRLKFGKEYEGRNSFELFNMVRRNQLLDSRQSNSFSPQM